MNIIVGDLWAQPGWRVVPTNLMGVMGRGVARQARDAYPWVENEYKSVCRAGNGKLVFFPEARLVCVAVKHHWRDKADLALIAQNTRNLARSRVGDDPMPGPIYLPLIGCGFGELEPVPVLRILASALDDRFTLVIPPEDIADAYPTSFRPGARADRNVAPV